MLLLLQLRITVILILQQRHLLKGIHVLIEKPAGVYTKNVLEMNEVGKASGKVFSIMYNQRANPFYQKIRHFIQSGELGNIKRTNWIITDCYRPQSYYDSSKWEGTWKGEGGGVILNQALHELKSMGMGYGAYAQASAFPHLVVLENIMILKWKMM